MSVFNNPLILGFENFERVLARASKASSEGYPPYNIEQTSENGLRVTLAVAGFSMDDLSVTIEDNELVIRGRQFEESAERIFIHRGIGECKLQRSYVLAEEIDIIGATLDSGLLHIDLERVLPETEVRTIKISHGTEKKIKRDPKPKIINMNEG